MDLKIYIFKDIQLHSGQTSLLLHYMWIIIYRNVFTSSQESKCRFNLREILDEALNII